MMRAPDSAFRLRVAGVTLIELAITIALVGIVSVLAVQFVMPVRAYIDASRRAALADTADTALRRIGRDLRLALPNSVRVTQSGGVTYIEFLLIRTGGRYRSGAEAATTTGCPAGAGTDPAEDVLSFGAADTCFKTLGTLPNLPVAASDFLVVFNLTPGTPNADAYQFSGTGGNKSQVSAVAAGATEDRVTFASHSFPYESPGKRFFIIEGPVTYACNPAAGTLTRYWGYTIAAAQPTPPAGGSGALMASGVTDCSATYETNVAAQSAGLVTLWLRLSMQDSRGDTESVNLYHTVHVNNVP